MNMRIAAQSSDSKRRLMSFLDQTFQPKIFFFYSQAVEISISTRFTKIYLTLMRPIDLPPHAPVAQKIADQR